MVFSPKKNILRHFFQNEGVVKYYLYPTMFSQLTDSLESTLKNLRGQGKLTEENVAESLREVRRAFLEADVNFNVTRDFVKAVKEKAMGSEVLTSVTPGQQIVKTSTTSWLP